MTIPTAHDGLQSQPESTDRSAPDGRSRASVGQWEPLDELPRRPRARIWLPLILFWTIALCLLGALSLTHLRLGASTGTIASIEAGGLLIDAEGANTWVEALAGQLFHEGAVLRAMPGTHAMIAFASGERLRIEAAGEWQILMLRASTTGRRSRTTIHQLVGVASYVSRPPQPGVDARLAVRSANTMLKLAGVATVVTPLEGIETIVLIDGQGVIDAWGEEYHLARSSTATIDPETQLLSVQ